MELPLVVNVSLKSRSYAFVEQPFCYIQINTSKTLNIEFTLTYIGFGPEPHPLTFSAFYSGMNSLCHTPQFDLRSV